MAFTKQYRKHPRTAVALGHNDPLPDRTPVDPGHDVEIDPGSTPPAWTATGLPGNNVVNPGPVPKSTFPAMGNSGPAPYNPNFTTSPKPYRPGHPISVSELMTRREYGPQASVINDGVTGRRLSMEEALLRGPYVMKGWSSGGGGAGTERKRIGSAAGATGSKGIPTSDRGKQQRIERIKQAQQQAAAARQPAGGQVAAGQGVGGQAAGGQGVAGGVGATPRPVSAPAGASPIRPGDWQSRVNQLRAGGIQQNEAEAAATREKGGVGVPRMPGPPPTNILQQTRNVFTRLRGAGVPLSPPASTVDKPAYPLAPMPKPVPVSTGVMDEVSRLGAQRYANGKSAQQKTSSSPKAITPGDWQARLRSTM